MIIKLPLTRDPAQDFITQLGSSKYEFYVRFNDRAGIWTMDMTDSVSQVKLLSGIPLLLGCDLLGPFLISNGSLVAYDESGLSADAGDPDTGDLGSRVNVYWFSADEVTSIVSPS